MTRRPVRWLSLVAGTALLAASPALAQVATLQAWQNPTTLTSTPGDNAGTVSFAGQTAPAGTNRVLLLAVVMELSASNTITTLAVSFGGTTMSPVALSSVDNGGDASREQAALFYLPDSQIPTGARTIYVTYNVNGTTDVDSLHVYWSVYSGVNQGTPFVGTAANAANAASVQFGTAVGYVTGGIVTYAAGNSGTNNNHAMAPPTDFTQRSRTQTSQQTSYTALTAGQAGNGTYPSTSTVTFTNANNTASAVAVASLRPTPRADLSVTKTDLVATYVPGGTTTYTIVTSNAGPNAVAGASLVDNLPAAITSAAWTCAGAGGAACPAASGTGSLNASVTLPVGGSLTYTVVATLSPTATGNLVNTATLNALSSTPDPNTANNTATDTDTPAPRADLAVTKTDGTTTYVPGTVTTYTIVASNAGPSAVTGAALVDAFDGTRITAVSWSCAGAGGATCPAASGSGNINASVNLPVGGNLTYTAVATIAAGATGNLANTATITAPGGTTDPGPQVNSATDTDTQAAARADLFVTKSGPASAFRGDPATYTIVFGNAGPSDVTGAAIADTFPAPVVGTTWTCVASGGASCPAASGSGNIGATVTLPRGARLTYTATATISSTFTGNLTNTAGITAPASPPDPVAANNSASVTTVVVAQTQNADVSVAKTGTSGPVAVGSDVTWSIVATNNGPATAQNVILSDPLPAGATWISTSTSVGTCSGSSTITCSLGPLANGATATVTIVARVDAFGTKSNTATVSNPNGSDYDPNPTNNSSTWLTTVSGSPTCGTPGGPGPGGTLSGVVNTYYPGTASVAAGQANTCIPVGTARGTGAAISSGDVLLVVQMQDATIDSDNDSSYGGNNGTGAGALAVNAGKYEYAVARDAVGGGGCGANQIAVTGTGANGGLLNSYSNSDATTTKGQARYQVVRVPQYSTATLNGVTALPWRTDDCDPTGCTTNGLGTGGILALDVAGTLTINGGVAAYVDGLGFRGAAGRQLTGGAGANTDYRTLSTIDTNGGKGEGNAGTPEWVYDAAGTSRVSCADPVAFNTYVVRTFQPNDGYPSGSMARGAPGNAGGGSTDDNPAANDRNSGGGGGSNGGAGGHGGLSWSTALDRGGLGAAVAPAISQVVLGGGGGAGTRNNSNCNGLDAVTGAQDAQSSSGGTGGGLIAIRAGTLSVPAAATLSANGSAAYNDTMRDGGGGGGAGGSIVLTVTNVATSMANLTLRANGGRGGDSWRTDVETDTTLGDRHGPGGGGGGGVIAYTVTAGAPTVLVAGGQPGITTTANDTFGALPGGVGQTLTASPAQIPGVGSGAECPAPDPDPTIALSHAETTVSAGGPVTILATVTNVSPFTSVLGSPTFGPVTATITLDAGLTSIVVASAPGWTCGVAGQVVTCTRTSALAARESFPPIQIGATVATSVVGPTTLTNTATVSGGGDVNTANDSATDSIGVRAPTLAHLKVFEALRRGRVVILRWRTSYEVNNLGFRVYRETAGQRELITPRILAGSAFGVGKDRPLPSGRSYAWIDREPAGDARYWLEDIDLDGSKTWTGPVVSEDGAGEGGWGPATLLAPSPALAGLGREQAKRRRWEGPRGVGLERRERPHRRGGGGAAAWTAPSQAAAKLLVAREGWYRVTKQDLLAAGFDPGTVPSSLRLLADGVEQAILVNDGGDGSFDAGDSVEFYGFGFESPWDGAHAYWLLSDRTGMRIATGDGGDATFPPVPSSFPFTVELRERTVQIFELPDTGDEENFFGAIVTTEPVVQSLVLSNVDRRSPAEVTLEIALQGGINVPHRVEVQLNGSDLGTIELDGQARAVQSLSAPVAWLREGTNEVTLVATAGDEDVSLVDYVRITYPHLYALDDGALRMTAPPLSRVTLDGLADRSLRVVDLSRPTHPRELAVTFASSAEGGLRARFSVPRRTDATLYAFTPGRVLSPQAIVANEPSSWSRRDNAADFLILGHSALLAQLEPLRRLRAQQGLATSLVDVTDVYDEFAYGQKTPYAIRDFLRHAALAWHRPPRYVLLVGDATFDPRNYLGEGDFDLVPAKLIRTTYIKAGSDDWYVDWDGDGIPELAIGRLPARTPAEASAMVAKIVASDAAAGRGAAAPGWAKRVLFVSGPADDYDFPAVAGRLRALLPRGFRSSEVSIDGRTAAREAIVAGFNAGQLVVNFAGHGSTGVWMERSDGGVVFTGGDAAALGSGAALVVSMTCLNGQFYDLWTESLAEALLKAPAGGAAAVWASSALTEPSAQAPMDEELFRGLFAGAAARLGDATARAKAATSDLDVRRSWILFGDPTMRLR